LSRPETVSQPETSSRSRISSGPRTPSRPRTSAADDSPANVEARDRDFVLGTYARTPFHPRRGRGARLWDADGRVYWDLLAGIAVNVLGHAHPRIAATLRAEARGLLHVSNLYYHPAPGLLAERLVAASGLSRVFFCNSGTEANEAALKFARLGRPGRMEVVALAGGFHGRTFGALSITSHEPYRAPFEPLVPGARFVPPNDLAALDAAVGERTAAIVLEPIQGEGGVVPLRAEFLRAARARADAAGALLVFDEIQCGLGRTGSLFAFQKTGVVPDMVTLAKPLGGGLPLGAVIAGPALDGVVRAGQHGTTFGGNPLACRLGLVVLEEIERAGLLARVERLGAWLGARLRRLQARCPAIVEVRGAGLMWGVELDRDAAPVARALLARGFVVGTAQARVLRLLPPYVCPRSALAAFVAALEDILSPDTTGSRESALTEASH
jgi:predicted acetylornithine/succinylornithine family transaminase